MTDKELHEIKSRYTEGNTKYRDVGKCTILDFQRLFREIEHLQSENTRLKAKKEVKYMTSALLEKDRTDYINGMKKYLDNLRKMPEGEVKKIARESLHKSGILTKDGNLTSHYRKNME